MSVVLTASVYCASAALALLSIAALGQRLMDSATRRQVRGPQAGSLAETGYPVAAPGLDGECFPRKFLAGCLLGLFGYAALLGAAAQLGVPFPVAAGIFGVLAIGGLVVAVADLRTDARTRRAYLLVAATAVALGVCMTLIPLNPIAADPSQYAFDAATLFRASWAAEHVPRTPGFERVGNLIRETQNTRAAALALLWPPAALGLALTPNAAVGVTAAYLLLGLGLLVDLFGPRVPILARLVLGLGAVGPWNELAVLSAGALGHTFALAIAIGSIWLCAILSRPEVRWVVMLTTGYLIGGAYPEFLVVLPLYWGCLVLLRRPSIREAAMWGVALVVGFVLVQLATRGANLQFVLAQQASPTTWLPLASTPATPLDVWSAALGLSDVPRRILALCTIPVAIYVWRFVLPRVPAAAVPLPALAVLLSGLVAFGAFWTYVPLHAANPNYVTFKLACWVGLGLTLGVWLSLGNLAPRLRGLVLTALLLVAGARTVLLVGDTSQRIADYETGPSALGPAVEVAVPAGATCQVRAPSDDQWVLARTVAISAAVPRGCDLTE